MTIGGLPVLNSSLVSVQKGGHRPPTPPLPPPPYTPAYTPPYPPLPPPTSPPYLQLASLDRRLASLDARASPRTPLK